MACSDYSTLWEALAGSFDKPYDAVICPFTSDMGAGLGLPLFGLFVFGMFGLGLSIKAQHPGPILVTGILSASLVAFSVPGLMVKIVALVIFFGIAAVGFIVYKRAQSTL